MPRLRHRCLRTRRFRTHGLLYNTRNDRALYPALMNLGGRQDLTITQRETIQTIWANWAVRRAGAAIDNDDNNRAVDILEAAAAGLP